MREYGVSLDEIWNKWTPKQVNYLVEKAHQRKAKESLDRIMETTMAMSDLSKNPKLMEQLLILQNAAKQYAPATEIAAITAEQQSKINFKQVPKQDEPNR